MDCGSRGSNSCGDKEASLVFVLSISPTLLLAWRWTCSGNPATPLLACGSCVLQQLQLCSELNFALRLKTVRLIHSSSPSSALQPGVLFNCLCFSSLCELVVRMEKLSVLLIFCAAVAPDLRGDSGWFISADKAVWSLITYICWLRLKY